jgi:hypothetical protein
LTQAFPDGTSDPFAARRGFREYVKAVEENLTPEERKTLDTFREHYADAAKHRNEECRDAPPAAKEHDGS